MANKLLIVESPAKAKTIEKYLGGEFVVKSSFGHIRDLDKGTKGVIIENGFEPTYIVSPEKMKVVAELKRAVSRDTEVWLATDEDREGEAISWHLCEVLGLDPRTTKRITFSEITKEAIQKAILKPRTVDIDLVNAQQARRILDRLVGFELSEVLWRKVKGKLSAGRVQSVSVKLIVEREREITTFETEAYFKVTAIFNVENDKGEKVQLKADLINRLETIKDATDFVNKANGAKFTIEKIETKPTSRKPAAPFTTSTLQQEASRKLNFGVNRTMSAAQRLYEVGHITYMRTDSTNLGTSAVGAIADQIQREFGEKYVQIRQYKSKTANAQEAHEAIRPTNIAVQFVNADSDEKRLYDLIWKRTIASQMADARLEKTNVDISISSITGAILRAEGEVMIFDGFLKVYIESKDDDEDEDTKGMLPPLKVKQVLDLNNLQAVERYTRQPARYTEASLVKKLEELGIGRPSTYAPTISKIMEKERGYVTKESRDGEERSYRIVTLRNGSVKASTETEITGATSDRLYPSDIGIIVTDFLDEHFVEIMNYSFTAEIEDQLDRISNGTFEWKKMLTEFYFPFHEQVTNTVENADRARGKRVLGKDPASGHSVIVQITRYGPVVQIGDSEELTEEEKPRYANLMPGQSMETVTFEEAMELFKLPRTLGTYKNEDLIVNNGRFGPYVKLGEVYANFPRTMDPMNVSREEAITIMEAKLKESEAMGHYKSKPITKGKGRFGPFLKWNDIFINVPKKYDIETINERDAVLLIEGKVEKEANRYIVQWESEDIAIENGRWGPYIKYKKANVKIPKVDGKSMEADELKDMPLEKVKAWIEAALPGTFTGNAAAAKASPKTKAAPKKKAPAKKPAPKKK